MSACLTGEQEGADFADESRLVVVVDVSVRQSEQQSQADAHDEAHVVIGGVTPVHGEQARKHAAELHGVRRRVYAGELHRLGI